MRLASHVSALWRSSRGGAVWAWAPPTRRSSSDATVSEQKPAGLGGGQSVFEVLHEGGGGPTEKQLRFAESLAALHHVQIPQEARSSREACSTFIERLQSTPRGGGGHAAAADASGAADLLAATDKQQQYARRLALEHGIKLQPDVLASRRACSDFIDSIPPTQKQVDFARALAERNGVRLPPDVFKHRKACSEFIDACQQGSLSSSAPRKAPWAVGYTAVPEPDRALDAETLAVLRKLTAAAHPNRPSLYQLLTGVLTAQKHNVGVPAEALQDIRAMGRFIQQSSKLPATTPSAPAAATAAGATAAAAGAAAATAESGASRSGAAADDKVDARAAKALGSTGAESGGGVRLAQVLDLEEEEEAAEDCESKVLEIVLGLCADDADSSKGASVADVQSLLADQYDIHTDLHTVRKQHEAGEVER